MSIRILAAVERRQSRYFYTKEKSDNTKFKTEAERV